MPPDGFVDVRRGDRPRPPQDQQPASGIDLRWPGIVSPPTAVGPSTPLGLLGLQRMAGNDAVTTVVAQRQAEPSLSRGDRHVLVELVQGALQAGGRPVPMTGVYDGATRRAVRDFQQRYRLRPADGVVREQTARALGLGPFWPNFVRERSQPAHQQQPSVPPGVPAPAGGPAAAPPSRESPIDRFRRRSMDALGGLRLAPRAEALRLLPAADLVRRTLAYRRHLERLARDSANRAWLSSRESPPSAEEADLAQDILAANPRVPEGSPGHVELLTAAGNALSDALGELERAVAAARQGAGRRP